MKRPVLLAALALASFASAQRGPLPGIPLVPVNHPALAAQPLMQPDTKAKKAPAPTPAKDGKNKKGTKRAKRARPRPKIDPDTVGPKAKGNTLKKRIKKVTDLKWGKNLWDMKARSAATGKPILYLQALGTLTGFA